MRKGVKVIYNNVIYEVWEKHKNHVKIYIPDAAAPELTMLSIGVNKVKPLKEGK